MWLVNGTQRATFLLDIRNDLVLSEEITTPEGSSVQNLTIPARAQYNGTRVQCLSLIISGPLVDFVESGNATLTIQGISIKILLYYSYEVIQVHCQQSLVLVPLAMPAQ